MSLDATQPMSETTAHAVLLVFAHAFSIVDGDIVDNGGRPASEHTLATVAKAQAVLDGLS